MNGVRVVRRLFWHGAAPFLPSGALDTEALARALARSHYGSTRRFYSRAQHAVVLSRGVESVSQLDEVERRVVAMQAWLADIRAVWLGDGGAQRLSGLGKTGLRTLDVETLAQVFATVFGRSGAAHDGAAHGSDTQGGAAQAKATREGPPPRGVAEFERRLRRLGELGDEERRRLALYALLGEAVTAGLGIDEGEAVLAAAGLDPRIPKPWADSLGAVWRMAETAVRRDVSGTGAERPAFPALKEKIEPLDPEAAARCWLERYRTLKPGDGVAVRGTSAARGRSAARSNPAARGTSAVRSTSGDMDKGERE